MQEERSRSRAITQRFRAELEAIDTEATDGPTQIDGQEAGVEAIETELDRQASRKLCRQMFVSFHTV